MIRQKRLILLLLAIVLLLMGCFSSRTDTSFDPNRSSLNRQETTEATIPSNPPLDIIIEATQTSVAQSVLAYGNNLSIYSQCGELTSVKETSLATGLILDGVWNGDTGFAFLGDKGIMEPKFIFYDGGNVSIVSDTGKWIASFEITNVIDELNEFYSIRITVTDIQQKEEFQLELQNVALSRFGSLRWINNSQLVLPLKNEGDMFGWLVWNPFNDKLETITLELDDNAVEFFRLAPVYDPQLELFIYPCSQCENIVYVVRNQKSGELAWKIDFGETPSYAYRGVPVWSHNGEFLAVAGGSSTNLNKIWIFSREGVVLHKFELPATEIIGAERLTWSPDNNMLAFSYANIHQEENLPHLTLAYIDIENSTITNSCVELPTTHLTWSPDSSRIAFSQQLISGESFRLINIVSIDTGNTVQIYDTNGHRISGWADMKQLLTLTPSATPSP